MCQRVAILVFFELRYALNKQQLLYLKVTHTYGKCVDKGLDLIYMDFDVVCLRWYSFNQLLDIHTCKPTSGFVPKVLLT